MNSINLIIVINKVYYIIITKTARILTKSSTYCRYEFALKYQIIRVANVFHLISL